MYFNIDGLKPVTSESSLNELYAERQRINKLIEKKEREVSELQKQIYQLENGKNNTSFTKNVRADFFFPQAPPTLLIRNSYEFAGSTVGIPLNKNDLVKNTSSSNLHQSNGDDTLTQSIINSTIMMSSDF